MSKPLSSPRPIILDLDDATPLEKVREAERRLREFKRETDQLRRLYRSGRLSQTISSEERVCLREAYFARGGQIRHLPPGIADGALISAYWNLDRDTIVKNVREQIAAGRTLEAALAGTGLSAQEIQIEIEGEVE